MDPTTPPARTSPAGWLLVGLAGVLLVAVWGHQQRVAQVRHIDQDELEHLNAASFMARGETIYVDFFENHPPLTHVMLQPVVRGGGGPAAIVARGRQLSLALSAAILATVGWLGWRLVGVTGAALAPLLLLTHFFYFQKSMEVRPDVPSTWLLLLGLAALARGAHRAALPWLFAGGALLATGGLFTPKIVYAAAGGSLGLAVALVVGPAAARAPVVLRSLGAVAAGVACVCLLAGAEMARRGILGGFIDDCLRVSLAMSVPDAAGARAELLRQTFIHNAGVYALGLAGLGVAAARGRLRADPWVWVLGASGLVALAGLFLIRAPLRQYYLSFLPQLAVLASVALVVAVDWTGRRVHRFAAVGVGVALLVVCLAPVRRFLVAEPRAAAAQLATIEKVLELTDEDDRVLDCWNGLFLGRLPAYRYFYLNPAVWSVLDRAVVERELLGRLEDPAVKVVLAGNFYTLLPAPVRRAVRRDFERVPGTMLMVRRSGRAAPEQGPEEGPDEGPEARASSRGQTGQSGQRGQSGQSDQSGQRGRGRLG